MTCSVNQSTGTSGCDLFEYRYRYMFSDTVSTLQTDDVGSSGKSFIFDLCTNGDTLIIPVFGESAVYWFKIEENAA